MGALTYIVSLLPIVGVDPVRAVLLIPLALATLVATERLRPRAASRRLGPKEVLKLAYKMGYFDPDRKITLTELAERIGVKAPTLEEILRRALRKAVKYYLDRTE